MKAQSILSALLLSLLLAVAGVVLAQSGGSTSGGAASGGVLQPSNPGHPNQQELDNADQSTTNWLMMNKGYSSTRYSSLDQINTSNVSDLQVTCALALGERGSFESTPQIYDGVVYITTGFNTYAIDATDCNKLWEYDYKPTGKGGNAKTNRGVALYNGMVFRGTPDAHVIALDMRTGKLLWNIHPVEPDVGYFFSSAPIVYKGLVLIGTAGADMGAPGHVFAFDAATGKQVWDFNEIVPSTFGSAKAAEIGGGSNWASYTLDTSTGLLYVSVGNPAPGFVASTRPGKNLYTESVVVLDAMTGKLDHYYQQIPNDSHNWDTADSAVLFQLNGKKYMAVANQEGYLYVYDEGSHEFLYKVAVTTINKNADKAPTEEGVHTCPADPGGVSWYGPAYDPETGLLYTNAEDWCGVFYAFKPNYVPGEPFFAGKVVFDPVSKAAGWTTAVDAQTGDTVWKRKSTLPMVSSVTPTAGGLLFTGEQDGHFLALNAKTGKVLYSFNTGGAISGGISTYEINSKQYVAVAVGSSSTLYGGDLNSSPYLFVFSLK